MAGAKVGVVSGFNYEDQVPVFERYFLGGGDSVRGFEYRTVSPTFNGQNIGGQSMVLLTSEISHPIWGPLRGFAFIDIGTVNRDDYNFSFNNFNAGAGYGIRMQIPQLNVPLEFAVAYPIINNQDTEKSKVRFHFNIGVGLSF